MLNWREYFTKKKILALLHVKQLKLFLFISVINIGWLSYAKGYETLT